MIDLFAPLDLTYRTIAADLSAWFSSFPGDVAWNVISDYCIGDRHKQNDTFAFSIVANHDSAKNICEYIKAVAPSDIKSTRQVPLGLVQYLNSPIAFSITYVVARDSALLRDYISVESVKASLPDIEDFLRIVEANSPAPNTYFAEVSARIRKFKTDIARSRPLNAKLVRQMHLVALFAATVFKYLTLTKKPAHIRWISDRDAILDQYDGLVYDLAYLYFLLNYGVTQVAGNETGQILIDKPHFLFETPERTGHHRYDELIRLPDFLAGTLADLNIKSMACSHEKFAVMLREVFYNSPNNTIIQVLGDADRVTTRRIGFSAV